MSGGFITLEGTEGGGKSTQAALLGERLRRTGRTVRVVREPGGTELSEAIRDLLKHHPAGARMTPETELLLMNAARAQLVGEVIRPALAAGEMVVCDRFHHSTLAYQGWGRGLPLGRVREVVSFAVGDLLPDLTLLLWVPPEVSLARQRARVLSGGGDADRFEREGSGFFERVAEGYRHLAQEEPGRVVLLDATPPIECVHERIWEIVAARWPATVHG